MEGREKRGPEGCCWGEKYRLKDLTDLESDQVFGLENLTRIPSINGSKSMFI